MKTSRLPARHGNDHLPGGYDPIPGLATETFSVFGSISRSGAAGNLTIVTGALNATTTLIGDHDTIVVESGIDCDIVSSPSRIVIETAGMYWVQSVLIDLDGGGGDYGLIVGHGINSASAIWAPGTSARRVVGGLAVVKNEVILNSVDVGDYFTQVVGQNSGSDKTFTYLATLNVALIPEGVLSEGSIAELDGGAP